MDLAAILRRIDQRIAALGTTDRAVSMRATNSTDTIRNWRRRVAEGDAGGASTRTLTQVAAALEVSPEWLIHGASSGQRGLAEPEALLFSPAVEAHLTEDAAAKVIAALAPATVQAALYRVATAVPLFALLEGDYLIIDLGRGARDGELALIRQIDPDTGDQAISKIMQKAGDYLISPTPGRLGAVLRMDSNRLSVAGPIVASFRRS